MKTPDISKHALFEEIGYEPHEHQWLIHNSEARFRIPCCGRRFGKSQAAGHEITYQAFAPDSYIWIVGPTYKTGEKEFRVVYHDFIHKLGRKIKGIKKSYNVKQGDMRIELPWNTIIEVVSAEKQDSLLGEGLDFACMSETARHAASTWEQYIEPSLTDKRGGAIFPSTPKGGNWYKGIWAMGQSPLYEDYHSWRMPSWYNSHVYPGGFNPQCHALDPKTGHHGNVANCGCNDEIVRIYNQTSAHYWAQEYAAEFTSREGKIYKYWNADKHIIDFDYNPFWRNWLAFDFGFTDPFCCYDIQIDQSDNVYVWREYQVRNKTTWEHAQILRDREQPEGYHITCCAADPRGPDEIGTLQLVLQIPILHNAVGWSKGVESIERWMKIQADGRPKFFVDRSCTELIRQIAELQTPELKEGKNAQPKNSVREGQKDFDDHGPDAIRYFFNEWQVMGASVSLEDVYGTGETYKKGGQTSGYFTAGDNITLGGRSIGY